MRSPVMTEYPTMFASKLSSNGLGSSSSFIVGNLA